jgi:hypothetical protein
MPDVQIRLYKFLVRMGRITKEQYKDITGEDYAE